MTVADKGARVGNFIIDTLLFAILLLLQFFIAEIFLYEWLASYPSIPDVYVFVFYFIYYFIFEYFTGTTPGKKLTKTKVVAFNGQQAGIRRLFVRSLARLMLHDYISFVFGQGLHDRISGTVVIRE